MDENKLIIYFIALLIILREGYVLRDKVEPNPTHSKIWHVLGWLMRFILWGLAYRLGFNTIELVILAVMLSLIYNSSCSVGLKKGLFYLSDKGIDGFIKRLFR